MRSPRVRFLVLCILIIVLLLACRSSSTASETLTPVRTLSPNSTSLPELATHTAPHPTDAPPAPGGAQDPILFTQDFSTDGKAIE
jgi:hypothetical protein